MTAPVIKGYCPGALRPMMSGDGLVVRIRPFGGRLSPAQVSGIAILSEQFGNGIIDLSSRANVQLRGVREASHPPLIDGLRRMGLIDASEAVERRRNVIVSPFWRAGDETEALSLRLTDALGQSDAPDLPHKFGFAIDAGETPVLQDASADIRIERASDGHLLLVAGGMAMGRPITSEGSIDACLALARWFVTQRNTENRMAQLLQTKTPDGFTTPRQPQTYDAAPGRTDRGVLAGFAFGQLTANSFGRLAACGSLRVTPWRMVLIEGAKAPPAIDGLISDANDPLLRITACTGAPACAQAQAATRPLAQALAQHLAPPQALHISGCAKGCAHPGPAPFTLTATTSGFDLVKLGRAGDTPAATALSTDDIIKALTHAP